MSVDIKTVIPHCKRLSERKQSMLSQMNKFGFSDYFFYEDFDAEELTDDIISKVYVSGLKNALMWILKINLWGHTAIYKHKRWCNSAEVSLAIKFGMLFTILKDIHCDCVMFLEDDVILCDDFDIKLQEYLCATPSDWDAIYFGSGAHLVPAVTNAHQIAYRMNHPASRCADSIILKHAAICDLALAWFPFCLEADFELAYQHYKHGHRVYWWEPSLSKQGSQHGIFTRSL